MTALNTYFSGMRSSVRPVLALQEDRFWEIDVLRGVAIVMMVIYHFLWDLHSLGGYDIALRSGFWSYFAARQSGGVWSAATEVPGGVGSMPSLAADAAGTVYLVWKGLSPDIYFSSRPTGAGWSSREPVDNGPTEAAVENPAVAADPAGNVVVAWQDSRSSSGDWGIYAADRTTTGLWSNNVRIDDDPGTANQVMPAVAVDPAGNAYALWTDNRSGDSDVEFAYRPAGGVWAANLRVDDDSGFAEQGMTAIAVDAAGNANALWLDKRTGKWRLLFSQARHKDVAMPLRRHFPLINLHR